MAVSLTKFSAGPFSACLARWALHGSRTGRYDPLAQVGDAQLWRTEPRVEAALLDNRGVHVARRRHRLPSKFSAPPPGPIAGDRVNRSTASFPGCARYASPHLSGPMNTSSSRRSSPTASALWCDTRAAVGTFFEPAQLDIGRAWYRGSSWYCARHRCASVAANGRRAALVTSLVAVVPLAGQARGETGSENAGARRVHRRRRRDARTPPNDPRIENVQRRAHPIFRAFPHK